MVQFNSKDNEILVKIVFYGPGLSGKTTNLQKLHELVDPGQRTDLFSVNTMEDRTLFFDLLPLDLGIVYGNTIKLQIYTVPGQVHYDSTRRIVLSGADGVVFVADSDVPKMQDNVQSINNLYHNLQANRINIKEIPLVIQYNKRDLPNIADIKTLEQKLNFRGAPHFEAVAVNGIGVLETFVEAVKQTIRYIFEKYQLSKGIKNADELLLSLEKALTKKVDEAKAAKGEDAQGNNPQANAIAKAAGSRTVLKYTHDVDRDDKLSQDQLLKKAITSNMETARLYTELKKTQEAVIKKNEELGILYKQLEKSNGENLKMRRFLENLVNFAGEAIITFNDLWVIQNWNKAAEELFGYSRNQIINQNIHILFPEEGIEDLNHVLSYVKQGKVVRGFETHLKNLAEARIKVNLTFSPIKNQKNDIIAFTAIVRDLSSLSQMHQTIQRLQQFESVAGILPDWLEILGSTIPTPSPETLESLKLTQQLAEANPPQIQAANINHIVAQVRGLVHPMLQRKGIEWREQLFPNIPTFFADPLQIVQILLNLVLNAVTSFEPNQNKRITLGTHFAGKELLLQFLDNGRGLAKEELDQLFQTGMESDKNFTHLRIQMTRELVQHNKGMLRIDSAPGKGTKVTLRFPCG